MRTRSPADTTDPLAVLHGELVKHIFATLFAERAWCHRWGEPSCLVDLYWDVGGGEQIELETVRVHVHDSDLSLRLAALRVADAWHERLARRTSVVVVS
jgi:hypothetical protein